MEIYPAVEGDIYPLSSLEDAVFSQEILGKGLAILPKNNIIYAPITGTVTSVFPTQHAIGIVADNGLEVLVHIGIDTVKLNGQGFHITAQKGDQVKQGDVLGKIDLESIQKSGYNPITMVIITNSDQYHTFNQTKSSHAVVGEPILGVN